MALVDKLNARYIIVLSIITEGAMKKKKLRYIFDDIMELVLVAIAIGIIALVIHYIEQLAY